MYCISSLRNFTQAVLNGNIIVLNVFIRKLEQLKTNDLGVQPKKLKKEQQSKAGREKRGEEEEGNNKDRCRINKLENDKKLKLKLKFDRRDQKTKSWFFRKTNKIDK